MITLIILDLIGATMPDQQIKLRVSLITKFASLMAMPRCRERACVDFLRVLPQGVGRGGAQVGVFFEEFGLEIAGQTEEVGADENLAVAVRAGTDADRGDGEFFRNPCGDGTRDQFQHEGKRPGVFRGVGIGEELFFIPLHFPHAAEFADRLRA